VPRPSHPAAPRTDLLAAHLALVGAQLSFGLFPIFGQLLFRPGGLSPLSVGAWRITLGAGILMTLAAAVHGRQAVPARAHLARFLMAAFLGVAINQGLFLVGLSRSTPINATLVMCVIPVFTFAIAAVAGQERFSAPRLAGVLVALGGTVPLVFEDGFHSLGRYGLGNLLMIANALSYSGYLVMVKPLLRRYPPLVVIAWAYLLSLPMAPYFAWGERLLPQAGHPVAWWSLAYIVVFPTVLAYLFSVFALARVRASTAATYNYSQPVVTALASWVAFGETPSAAVTLTAAAVFAGIWLVARPPGERAASAAPGA